MMVKTLNVTPVSYGQFIIDSKPYNGPGEWYDIYVNFSGYFGSIGPHAFAAAPEMVEALRLWAKYDAGNEKDGIELMANYSAALEATKAILSRIDGESA